MDMQARIIGLLGALALVPVAAFALGRSDFSVAIAGLNVVLIVSCLYVAMSTEETTIGNALSG